MKSKAQRSKACRPALSDCDKAETPFSSLQSTEPKEMGTPPVRYVDLLIVTEDENGTPTGSEILTQATTERGNQPLEERTQKWLDEEYPYREKSVVIASGPAGEFDQVIRPDKRFTR